MHIAPFLLAFLLLVSSAMMTAAHPRPNIVLLLSDDQAWTDYGFMGHPDIQTPNLDELAGNGLLFRRGYLAAPVCRPSLASMITGLHPSDHGVTGNDVVLGSKDREKDDLPLREAFYQHPGFIELLSRSGYLTHQSGKWWEGSWREGGFTHGMKEEGRHGSHASLAIGREGNTEVTDFIDMALEQGKPFFVWYGVFLPHTPHNPPERLLEKYRKPGRAEDVAKYYAMCEWLDEACGDLIGHLDERGIRRDTLIIYICDNGWAARSTNGEDPNQTNWNEYALRSKTSPYENGIRTPIIFSWPGRIAPQDDPNFAHSIDLFPTIAAATGLEAPAGLPGIDLLDKETREARKIVFGSCHSTHNITIGDPDKTLQYLWAIEGEWKLLLRYAGEDSTRYRETHIWDTAPVRLFNLKNDPHERQDLAAGYPDRVADLRSKIESWFQRDGNNGISLETP